MHEESLVRNLLAQVQAIESEHKATGTHLIEVEIGPLSGVEPLLFQSAFDRLTSASGGSCKPHLRLHEVLLTLSCRQCGSEFVIDELRFECPACLSNRVTVVKGDSVKLLSVELRLPTEENMAGLQK